MLAGSGRGSKDIEPDVRPRSNGQTQTVTCAAGNRRRADLPPHSRTRSVRSRPLPNLQSIVDTPPNDSSDVTGARPGPLAETYRMGFEALGATSRMVRVAPERLMEATVRAHAMLLERVSR